MLQLRSLLHLLLLLFLGEIADCLLQGSHPPLLRLVGVLLRCLLLLLLVVRHVGHIRHKMSTFFGRRKSEIALRVEAEMMS